MTLLLTFGIIATLMAGMAVGVIFSNKPLRGSCGGTGSACACEEAGTPGACKLPAEPSEPIEFKPPGAIMTLRKR
ncbi:hypothetical protein ACNOYE_38430 [Nannocystaceae bacterium ST9]